MTTDLKFCPSKPEIEEIKMVMSSSHFCVENESLLKPQCRLDLINVTTPTFKYFDSN